MAYALITGSSKGIGRAIAHELARRKFNLILTARSENLLHRLAQELTTQYNVDVQFLAADLSSPLGVADVTGFVIARQLPVNVLVNNSGYGLWGRFDNLNLQQQINMLRLNNESVIGLTYGLLPVLREQHRAYILNVASTTAYQAVPFMSVYAASKSFIVSFSRGLSKELRGSHVSVTCLSPGATETNFMEVAGIKSCKLIDSAKRVSMTADDVAAQAVQALLAGKTEHIPGWLNKITAYANNLLPKKIVEGIAANIYKPITY